MLIHLYYYDMFVLIQCGKSAAVFACAREQGFNVIEVFPPAFISEKFSLLCIFDFTD